MTRVDKARYIVEIGNVTNRNGILPGFRLVLTKMQQTSWEEWFPGLGYEEILHIAKYGQEEVGNLAT